MHPPVWARTEQEAVMHGINASPLCSSELQGRLRHLDAPRHARGGEELVVAVEGDGAQHVRRAQRLAAVLQRRAHLQPQGRRCKSAPNSISRPQCLLLSYVNARMHRSHARHSRLRIGLGSMVTPVQQEIRALSMA